MSNSSAASILAQEEADILQQTYVSNYCLLAAAALIFFEHIVTFSEEIHVIWGTKLTTVTVIFALNRYLLMVQGINFALSVIRWHSPLSCEATTIVVNMMILVLEAVTASFSAFRTYAISGHQIIPALFVLLLGLAPVGINFFILTRMSYAFVTYVGSYPLCNSNDSVSIGMGQKLVIFGRICPAVSDLIVVIVTWFKTSGLAKEVRKLRLRGSIATLLIRDGTLYFIALLLLNILEIVIRVRSEHSQASLPIQVHGHFKLKCKQESANYIVLFLPPISSILVSRFILNLRQVSLGSMGLNTASHSDLNTPDFPSRLVGNFGAEVQHTSLVFENVEDGMEDEQGITEACETYELAQMQ